MSRDNNNRPGKRTSAMMKAEIGRELQFEFGLSTARELPAIIETVEERLVNSARALVTEIVKSRFPSTRVSADGQTMVVQGERFQLLLTGNVMSDVELERHVLFITILPLERPYSKSEFLEKRIPISGPGRDQNIELLVWPKFHSCLEVLADGLRGLFQSGYAWLLQHMRAKLAELATDTVKGVYSTLRSLFYDRPKVVEAILLAIVENEDVAYYIMDPDTSDRLIHGITAVSQGVYAPLELVAELGATEVPFQKLIAKDAFQKEGPTPIDLRGDWYIENRPAYEMGEETAFGTQKITVFPIVSRGKRLLAASFPSNVRAEAMPVLMAGRAVLAQVFEDGVGGYRQAWSQMRTRARAILLREAAEMPEWLIRIIKLLL